MYTTQIVSVRRQNRWKDCHFHGGPHQNGGTILTYTNRYAVLSPFLSSHFNGNSGDCEKGESTNSRELYLSLNVLILDKPSRGRMRQHFIQDLKFCE